MISTRHNMCRFRPATLPTSVRPMPRLNYSDKLFSDFPDKSQLAQAHLQMAECLLARDRVDDAIGEYRAALNAEKAYPNSRTQVWLDFPWLVVTRRMSDLYVEARLFLDWRGSHSLFPIEEYRLATVLAFLADESGDSHSARKHAVAALNAAAKEHWVTAITRNSDWWPNKTMPSRCV